jgi:hypothetical protein
MNRIPQKKYFTKIQKIHLWYFFFQKFQTIIAP